ncbi:restriction endonuclease subunit S [Mycobacterium sp. Marseille-P9652]|uniref:restriction endonuclease subunit S n=1 Tax=Mycobacterium sp. Marseille-P9652 TaxID=2654950 RepID=UPI0012E91D28|nr:restriction endonuclease subunit S [Mycobacterium sp. Marseille-P9652]
MSRSDWFGDLPSSWRAAPLGYYFDVVLGKMLNGSKHSAGETQAPYLAAGSIQPEHLVLDETKTMAFTEAELAQYDLRKGDIVVVEGGAGYGRSYLLAEDMPGWGFQNHVARVRGRGSVRPGFLIYCLKACLASGFIEANNRTATLPSLSRDVLRALPIPIPALPEQREIANYLDRETLQIDTLIGEQQRLIEMLRERRAAIGDRHFYSRSGKRETTLRRVIRPLARPAIQGLGVVTAYRDGSVTLRSNKRDEGYTFSDTEQGYQEVRVGDLVFHALDGFAGAVGISDSHGNATPVYHVCEVVSDDDPVYLAMLLRYLGVSGYLATQAPNVRQRSVDFRNWATFARVPVALPAADVQRDVVAEVRKETAKIDTLIAETEKFIELAVERRSALIIAAVTGQVDVREAA